MSSVEIYLVKFNKRGRNSPKSRHFPNKCSNKYNYYFVFYYILLNYSAYVDFNVEKMSSCETV